MLRLVRSLSSFVALSLLVAGCGASLSTAPATLADGGPQPFPLERAGGERAGWILVSHDPTALSVTWVLNPGWTLDRASLCARGTAFGWTDPSTCERRIPAGSTGASTLTVPFAEVGGADGACERAVHLQVQADVIEDATGSSASAYAGTFKGRIAVVPECRRVFAGCARTAGAWLETPEWPIDGAKLGTSTYSNVEMEELIALDPQSDASVLLARALIAAKLNVAAGAEPAAAVEPALAEAQSWLVKYEDASGRLPFGLKVTAEGAANLPGWDDGVNLAALLGRFDEGFAGSPRCDP